MLYIIIHYYFPIRYIYTVLAGVAKINAPPSPLRAETQHTQGTRLDAQTPRMPLRGIFLVGCTFYVLFCFIAHCLSIASIYIHTFQVLSAVSLLCSLWVSIILVGRCHLDRVLDYVVSPYGFYAVDFSAPYYRPFACHSPV